jgi:antitoxin component YwqK of YwqJK toxin-antitoxin module
MKFIFPFMMIGLIIASGCSSKRREQIVSGKLNGLHKYYYPDGQLYLEINYQDSLPHGTTKRYYKNGKLLEQSEYRRGIMHGLSKKFHDNGQLSQEVYYDSGRMNGIRKKYRKDGTLASEVPYYFDNPCAGIKEYFLSGNPVNNYPSIVITPKDAILKEDRYTLYISLSNKHTMVEFYTGKLTDGKYIDEDAYPITTENGIGSLSYFLPRGAFIMEKLNIIAKVKTDLGNYYITQIPYNLAAENR